ncbi:Crp/Fnr family transcriptional regulator [Anaeromicrobium sediminis]|uniref:Crp/Fnr family transcriptional regulator n=1 Tax=Anaeromicrobium sediminis TaxID=1478221 RepID=A0A267MGM8_9FIRM|nr:Crp/Fnr family transcriptional regulator [Anaeromicrobium sediminis]PAB58706.1 hypothetical protein CCE28_13630 [Anaeromicrobium sediminis]
MKITRETLINIPILENIKEESIDYLMDNYSVVTLKKGDILFHEKGKINRFYILLKGKVSLYKITSFGHKKVMYILNSREVINENVFDEYAATVSCEAFQDIILLSYDKKKFMELMEKDFILTKNILFSLSKKTRRLYRQLKNSVSIKIEKKIASKLWKLGKDFGVKRGDGKILIDLKISITYLADMIGSSRETISRGIKSLEKLQILELKNKKIILDLKKVSDYYHEVL